MKQKYRGDVFMKINNNIEKVLGSYKKQSVQKQKADQASGRIGTFKKDRIELSHGAKDFHAILKAVKNTPDIRQDKVAAVKSSIASGTYNVSTQEIAEKIIEGLIFNIKL